MPWITINITAKTPSLFWKIFQNSKHGNTAFLAHHIGLGGILLRIRMETSFFLPKMASLDKNYEKFWHWDFAMVRYVIFKDFQKVRYLDQKSCRSSKKFLEVVDL